MKLVINYDLISRIKDVNEPFSIVKVSKHRKFLLTLATTLDLSSILLDPGSAVSVIPNIPVHAFIIYGPSVIMRGITGIDIYEQESLSVLKKLVPLLQESNINTDLELLCQSYVYEKRSKICLNEEKLPQILQQKYIMVPAYTFNNNTKEVSVLQEHVVGSDEYVLSLGHPERQYKLAFAGV